MIKTRLFESQIPLGLKNQPAGNMAETRNPKFKFKVLGLDFLTTGKDLQIQQGKESNEKSKGHQRYHRWNMGKPNSRKAHGFGVPVVVREWESHLQGEGEQV